MGEKVELFLSGGPRVKGRRYMLGKKQQRRGGDIIWNNSANIQPISLRQEAFDRVI
jgi:hypothetical protein